MIRTHPYPHPQGQLFLVLPDSQCIINHLVCAVLIIIIIYVCGPALWAYYQKKYPPKEKSCGPCPQSNNQIHNGELFPKKKKGKGEKEKRINSIKCQNSVKFLWTTGVADASLGVVSPLGLASELGDPDNSPPSSPFLSILYGKTAGSE